MTDFVSEVQKIPYNTERVFAKLSDFKNLEKVHPLLPEGKIKDLSFDSDICSFYAEPIGKISMRIVERDPRKSIKLISEKSPVPFTCWIQLKEDDSGETQLKLTFRADIPFIFKGIVSKPLEEGIRKLAEALATLPY